MSPFTEKDWRNANSSTGGGDETTPITAAALEDMEDRLSTYTDLVAAAGIELGYSEITSNATSTSVYGTYTDITGLSVTVTVGTRPIKVIFDCTELSVSATTITSVVGIREGTTELAFATVDGHTAGEGSPVHREVRLAPSAGSHTYKISAAVTAAGTATINAAATSPAFIQVIEV